MTEKTVFISHSSADIDIALSIGTALEKAFGKDTIWVDYFDLSGSDELVPVIANAIGKAKWFILIASENSMKSNWVKHEAKLALYNSIEKKDYRLLTIKIDDCQFPEELEIELKSRKYIDAKTNLDNAIEEIINLLSTQVSTRSNLQNVFVDRGSEMDTLESMINNFKLVYVVGWHGIGKTSTVEEYANSKLGATYLKIELTAGHDIYLLCRQIISRTGNEQPASDATNISLLNTTMNALESFFKKTNGFIFFDDAEKAMDDAGEFRPYLVDFIDYYLKCESFKNSLVITTLHQPDIKIDQANKTQIALIKPLPDHFIDQCIKRWYFAIKKEEMPDSSDFNKMVKIVGGHPLAARLLSSFLAFNPPEILNRKGFVTSFRHNTSEYIMRSYLEYLSNLEITLLQIISVVGSGINVHDITSLSIIKPNIRKDCDPLEAVKNSLSRLSQRLLIIQEGEKLILHPIINQFFLDIAKKSNNFEVIAAEVGNLFFIKTNIIIEKLEKFKDNPNRFCNKSYKSLNYQLLNYLAPAHRLLLISGQSDKANRLPYSIKGHIREMVFIYYQQFKNYNEVILFCDQWLRIEPSDLDVMIYKARSLRKLGRTDEAIKILEKLSGVHASRVQAIIAREYGNIARDERDYESAIYHFKQASSIIYSSGNPIYPLAYIDLAGTLVDRATLRGTKDPLRESDFIEATNLLEKVKPLISNFDTICLPLYIDTLMNTGREIEAQEILTDSLEFNPDDPRLNIRMADILRKSPAHIDDAYQFAERAYQGGQSAGLTIMASIKIDKKEYDEALNIIKLFTPNNGQEQIIANTIHAKAYTGLQKFSEAKDILVKLDEQNDPYVCFAVLNNLYEEIRHLYYSSKLKDAINRLSEYEQHLLAGKKNFPNHTQIESFSVQYVELRTLINSKT
jgi:tetratricopeptide (TPR) repeat protein